MRPRLARSLALLVLTSSLLAGRAAAEVPAAAVGANGRIAFDRSPVNGLPNSLWSMTSSGSDQQQLTSGASGFGDVEPSYSPGGTMIAFARDQTDDADAMFGDIFVMQADGTGIKRLTATSASESYPDWTPDGSRIVFYSLRTGTGDIYSM